MWPCENPSLIQYVSVHSDFCRPQYWNECSSPHRVIHNHTWFLLQNSHLKKKKAKNLADKRFTRQRKSYNFWITFLHNNSLCFSSPLCWCLVLIPFQIEFSKMAPVCSLKFFSFVNCGTNCSSMKKQFLINLPPETWVTVEEGGRKGRRDEELQCREYKVLKEPL